MPGLNEFTRLYPEIDIDLVATEALLDLSLHDADVAFRCTNKPPLNVLGTHIANFAYAVYATPPLYQQYLDDPGSVGGIGWSSEGRSAPEWLLADFPDMQVRYRANSLNVAFNLARQGLGFCQLPCGLGDASAKLQRVPGKYQASTTSFWLLSHIDLRTTARIRIFRDFMLEAMRPYVPLIEGQCERYFEQRYEREKIQAVGNATEPRQPRRKRKAVSAPA
jgi:DNA-binding transcriptional LysR family regulator